MSSLNIILEVHVAISLISAVTCNGRYWFFIIPLNNSQQTHNLIIEDQCIPILTHYTVLVDREVYRKHRSVQRNSHN